MAGMPTVTYMFYLFMVYLMTLSAALKYLYIALSGKMNLKRMWMVAGIT